MYCPLFLLSTVLQSAKINHSKNANEDKKAKIYNHENKMIYSDIRASL